MTHWDGGGLVPFLLSFRLRMLNKTKLSATFHFLTCIQHSPLGALGQVHRGVQDSHILSIRESPHHYGDAGSPSRHLHVGDEPSCCPHSGLLSGLGEIAGDLTGHLCLAAVSVEQGLCVGNLYQIHWARRVAQGLH